MSSQDPWLDFENCRHTVKQNTVDRLKQVIAGFCEECAVQLSKSGKKQELIDRIVAQLEYWKATHNSELFTRARTIIYQVRTSGVYKGASRMPTDGSYSHPSTSHHYHSIGSVRPNNYYGAPSVPPTTSRYDPYAAARKPAPSTTSAATPPAAPPKTTLRFKPSPFFRIDQVVSSVVECPESNGAVDRRVGNLNFTLTPEQVNKLHQSNYQLRLFCTSSLFYTPPNNWRPNAANTPCPVEFPPTCEVRVNSVQLNANLKGLKKKPGTAPPADLGKAVRVSSVHSNRIEMVYVNSQQGAPGKKYYLVVMLVETTGVDQLVERLKKGKFKSSSEIQAKMAESASEDDDIIAGSQKMSLKCPLSYTRISTPCRSALCVHPQCFDATSWFSMMEQTTTWLCPVCEKVLNVDDLIVDGYFDEILKHTDEDVDDVIVEADGHWHTSDNKYASEGWKSSHTPSSTSLLFSPRRPKDREATRSPGKPSVNDATNGADDKGKRKADDYEIVILDSDDEDDARVKRELSPSVGGSLPPIQVPQSARQSLDGRSLVANVIDLTLDSDDEDESPASSASQTNKRKAPGSSLPSPTEHVWKKSRTDLGPRTNGHSVNGAAPSSSSTSVSNTGGHGYSLSGMPFSNLISQLIRPSSANSVSNATSPPSSTSSVSSNSISHPAPHAAPPYPSYAPAVSPPLLHVPNSGHGYPPGHYYHHSNMFPGSTTPRWP